MSKENLTIELQLTRKEALTLYLLANSGGEELKPLAAIRDALFDADPKLQKEQFGAWASHGMPNADLSTFVAAVEAL